MRCSECDSSRENNDKAEMVILPQHIALQAATHEQDKTKSNTHYFTVSRLPLEFRSIWTQT